MNITVKMGQSHYSKASERVGLEDAVRELLDDEAGPWSNDDGRVGEYSLGEIRANAAAAMMSRLIEVVVRCNPKMDEADVWYILSGTFNGDNVKIERG